MSGVKDAVSNALTSREVAVQFSPAPLAEGSGDTSFTSAQVYARPIRPSA